MSVSGCRREPARFLPNRRRRPSSGAQPWAGGGHDSPCRAAMPRVTVINCGVFSCRNKLRRCSPFFPHPGAGPSKRRPTSPSSESSLRRTVTLSTFPGPTHRKQYINRSQYAYVLHTLYQAFQCSIDIIVKIIMASSLHKSRQRIILLKEFAMNLFSRSMSGAAAR